MGTDELGQPTEQTPTSEIAFCETARLLLDDFGVAVQNVLLLYEQQFLALVEGDADANRFDLMIHEAVERKQNAKYAYLAHLDVHRCSS